MTDDKDPEDKTYKGPERRHGERRSGHDRRELIRFEPDKEDRRSHIDRRESKRDIWKDRDL